MNSAELLLWPVKKLAEWWRRRPISKLFHLADRAAELRDYEGLLR